MKIQQILLFAGFSLLMAACTSTRTETLEMEVSFGSEEPFFAESPEALQYTLGTEISDRLKALDSDSSKIAEVKLVSAVFETADSSGFADFSSLTLNMMAGGDSKAKALGVCNPIDSASSKITLKVSQESDVREHFRNAQKFLVCDLTPKKDREKPFSMKARLRFEMKLKN